MDHEHQLNKQREFILELATDVRSSCDIINDPKILKEFILFYINKGCFEDAKNDFLALIKISEDTILELADSIDDFYPYHHTHNFYIDLKSLLFKHSRIQYNKDEVQSYFENMTVEEYRMFFFIWNPIQN